MGKLVWTEPALGDVREIVRFVAKDSPRYAEKVAADIVETARRLIAEPRTGWRVPEFEDDLIRELFAYSYRVIYTIRDDACYILAVVQGNRDLSQLLARRGQVPPS